MFLLTHSVCSVLSVNLA